MLPKFADELEKSGYVFECERRCPQCGDLTLVWKSARGRQVVFNGMTGPRDTVVDHAGACKGAPLFQGQA